MTEEASAGGAMSDPLSWPVEPFEVPPHPCNLALLEAFSAYVLVTLDECIRNVAEGEEAPRAPRFVRKFHGQDADGVPGLLVTHSLLRFVLDQHHQVKLAAGSSGTSTDQRYEAALELRCAVTRNVGWLKSALHLSGVEAKLLLWTYAISHRRSEALQDAFSAVQFNAPADAYAAVAMLLGEPVDAVAKCFEAPNRLLAMRLLWKGRRTMPAGLDEFFEASDLLPAVLETVHRSQQAMLDRLLEPEQNWTLDPKVETPSAQFYEWFERPVAEAFAATARGRPLSADQIVALIEWLTGYQFEPAQCSLLAGHLTLEQIEQALKWCFVSNARCESEVTPLMALTALYVVAA